METKDFAVHLHDRQKKTLKNRSMKKSLTGNAYASKATNTRNIPALTVCLT